MGVIPARFASSRFPGKPLAQLAGKSLIQRVYEQVKQADLLSEVIVATDDERIFKAVEAFGGQARMTSADHASGTDRCAEIAGQFEDFQWVVNIQGDEPFLLPEQINQLGQRLISGDEIVTLAHPIREESVWKDPHVVKLIRDDSGLALYFSRSPIPYLRGLTFPEAAQAGLIHQHLGIYGFQRAVLLRLARLEPHPLEKTEGLEQLRWLAAGYRIHAGITHHRSMGIDTPEDLERAEAAWFSE